MSKLLLPVVLGALSLLSTTSKSDAASLVLQGNSTSITYIRADNTGLNYGADPTYIVGKVSATPGALRGLLSFDLSAIPAGATITDVSLALVSTGTGSTANQAGVVDLNLYDLSGNFVEGGGLGSGTATTTAATWLTNGTTNWATPGGDFSPTILSTLSLDPTLNSTGNTSTFASAGDGLFTGAAQSAVNTATPFTLLMKLNDTSEGQALRRAFFFVSDDGAAANAPKLTVTYNVPEPATTGFLLGTLALLGMQRVRRSAIG